MYSTNPPLHRHNPLIELFYYYFYYSQTLDQRLALWVTQCRGFASPATVVGGPTFFIGDEQSGPQLQYTRFIENFVVRAEGSAVVTSVPTGDAAAPVTATVASPVPIAPTATPEPVSSTGAAASNADGVVAVAVPAASATVYFTSTQLVVDLGVWCGCDANDPSFYVDIQVQPFPALSIAPVYRIAQLLHNDPEGAVLGAAPKRTVRPCHQSPGEPRPVDTIFFDTLCARTTAHPDADKLRSHLVTQRSLATGPFWGLAYPPVPPPGGGERSSVNFGDHLTTAVLVSMLTVIVGGEKKFSSFRDKLGMPKADGADKTLWLKHLINFFTLGLCRMLCTCGGGLE